MKKHFTYITLLLFIALAACDVEATLTYKVTNNSSSSIKVIRTRVDGQAFTDTFNIAAGQQITIAVNNEGLSGIDTYIEKGDSLRRFTRMDIYKNDTQSATTNFLRTSRWAYNKKTAHQADYVLTVADTDF